MPPERSPRRVTIDADPSTNREYTITYDALRPPHKNVSLTYVIPIRGEVSNGNFFKQIRDFSNQRGVKKSAFEVLYVRNNPKLYPQFHEAFIPENESIQKSISYIQKKDAPLPDGLETWQENILKHAKRTQLRVHSVDVELDNLDEGNPGNVIERARIVGENVVLDRFAQLQKVGGIVTVDADTRVGLETTKKIQEQMMEQSDVSMIRMGYDIQPTAGEGGQLLYESSPEERYGQAFSSLKKIIMGRQESGFYAIKTDSLPQTTPQGDHLGYLRDRLNPTYGKRIPSQGIRLYVQDRARPIGIGGLFGQMRANDPRESMFNHIYRPQHPCFTTFADLYERRLQDESIREPMIAYLQKNFPHAAWLADVTQKIQNGQEIRSELHQAKEVTLKIPVREYAASMVETIGVFAGDTKTELAADVSRSLREEQVVHALRTGAMERAIARAYAQPDGVLITTDMLLEKPEKQTQMAHFIRANQWMLDEVNYVRSRFPDSETAQNDIVKAYPNYFEPFEDTTYTYASAVLRGVTFFIEKHQDLFGPGGEVPHGISF